MSRYSGGAFVHHAETTAVMPETEWPAQSRSGCQNILRSVSPDGEMKRFTSPYTDVKLASPMDTPFVRKSTVKIACSPLSLYDTFTFLVASDCTRVTSSTMGTARAAAAPAITRAITVVFFICEPPLPSYLMNRIDPARKNMISPDSADVTMRDSKNSARELFRLPPPMAWHQDENVT